MQNNNQKTIRDLKYARVIIESLVSALESNSTEFITEDLENLKKVVKRLDQSLSK